MAGPAQTQEELLALLAKNPEILQITAPQVYASSVQIMATPNEFTLIFALPRPVIVGATGQGTLAAQAEPSCVLHLSPQTLKDLSMVVSTTLAQYEKDWGVIETEYSRRLALETTK